MFPLCTERNAKANFACSLSHRVSHYAIEANRSEEQARNRKRSH